MNNKVKTVYIAGPITGCRDYIRRFKSAQKVMRAFGYYVFNPADMFLPLERQGAPREVIMSCCLEILSFAGSLALLPGWQDSQGAWEEFSRFMEIAPKEAEVYEIILPDGFCARVSTSAAVCVVKKTVEDYRSIDWEALHREKEEAEDSQETLI